MEGPQALTLREREVLHLYVELGLNKLIADRLHVSIHTVKNHNTSIIRKLGVFHIGQAAVLYERWLTHNVTWPGTDRRIEDRRKGAS